MTEHTTLTIQTLVKFRKFVDVIEERAQHCDGPVTPFLEELQAASDKEKEEFTEILRSLYRCSRESATRPGDKEQPSLFEKTHRRVYRNAANEWAFVDDDVLLDAEDLAAYKFAGLIA